MSLEEYAGFEVNIPEGEYGRGSMSLWDRGSMRPRGEVIMRLERVRFKGRCCMIELRGRPGNPSIQVRREWGRGLRG